MYWVWHKPVVVKLPHSLTYLAKIDPAAKHPQLLVMAPTRELAIQVADACEHFMKYAKGINIVTLYGGQTL